LEFFSFFLNPRHGVNYSPHPSFLYTGVTWKEMLKEKGEGRRVGSTLLWLAGVGGSFMVVATVPGDVGGWVAMVQEEEVYNGVIVHCGG
jgi:hypothetical protein